MQKAGYRVEESVLCFATLPSQPRISWVCCACAISPSHRVVSFSSHSLEKASTCRASITKSRCSVACQATGCCLVCVAQIASYRTKKQNHPASYSSAETCRWLERLDISSAPWWAAVSVHVACFIFVAVLSSPRQVCYHDGLVGVRRVKEAVEAS